MGNSSSHNQLIPTIQTNDLYKYHLHKVNPHNQVQFSCFVVGSCEEWEFISQLWYHHSAYPSPVEIKTMRDGSPPESNEIKDISNALEVRYGGEVNPLTQLIIISPPTTPFRDSKLYSTDCVFTMPHLFTQDFNPMSIRTLDDKVVKSLNTNILTQQLHPSPTILPTHQSEALLPYPNPSIYLYSSPSTIIHNDHELGAHFLYQPRYCLKSSDRPRESRMFQFYPTDRFSDDKLLSNFDRSQQCTVLLHLLPPADVDQYGSFVEEGGVPRLAQDLCLTPETLAMFPIIIIDLNYVAASLLRATQFLQDFAHLNNTGCAFLPSSLLDNMSLFFIIKGEAIHFDDSLNFINDEVLIALCKEMGFKQPPTIFLYGESIYNPIVMQSILKSSKSDDLCPNDIAEIDLLYSNKQHLHDALTASFLNHFQAFHLNLSPYEQFTRYFKNALRNDPIDHFDYEFKRAFYCNASTYGMTPPFLVHRELHRMGVYLPVLPYQPKPILSVPALTAPRRAHASRLFFQNAIQALQLLIIPLGFVSRHNSSDDGFDDYVRNAISAVCFDGTPFSHQYQTKFPAFSYTTEVFASGVNRLDIEHYYQYEYGIFERERQEYNEQMLTNPEDDTCIPSRILSVTQLQQQNYQKKLKYCLPSLHQEVQYFPQSDIHISTPVITTLSQIRQSLGTNIVQQTPTTADEKDNIVITPTQLNTYLAQLPSELEQIYVCKKHTLHLEQPSLSFTSPLYQYEQYKYTCYQQKYNLHGLYKPYTQTNMDGDQASSTNNSIHLTPLLPPSPFTLDTSQYLDRDPIYPNAIVVPKSTLATIPPDLELELIGSQPFFPSTNSIQSPAIITPTPLAPPRCDESNDVTIHSPCQRYNYIVQLFNAWALTSEVFSNVLPYRPIGGVIVFNLRSQAWIDAKNANWNLAQLNNLNLPLHVIALCPSKDDNNGKDYDNAFSQIYSLVEDLRCFPSIEENNNIGSTKPGVDMSIHVGQGEYFTKGPFVSVNDLEKKKKTSSFYQPLLKSTLPIADPQPNDSKSVFTKWKIHVVQNHFEFIETIHRINFSALASRTLLHEVSFGNVCVDLSALPL